MNRTVRSILALAVTTCVALAAALCRHEGRLTAVWAEITDRAIYDRQWQLLHVTFACFMIDFIRNVFALAQVFAQDLRDRIRQ